MFAVLNLRGRGEAGLGSLGSHGGLGMATFSTFVSLVALLPLAMNQFAIDRAGLTMTMLAPVETMTLLRGKALGNAAIAAIPGALCFTAAALLFPGGDPALWMCIPLSAIAAYLVAAPVAAILSAMFPRAVDLNSIGRGSNAHGAAGLLGMLTFVAAAAPGALLTLLTRSVLDRPNLAPVVVAGWIGVAAILNVVLFKLAAGIFERRRENLALTSQRS
jgi:ABC-type multidrug transport system permease subunit